MAVDGGGGVSEGRAMTDFPMLNFTPAALRLDARIRYHDNTAEGVFEVMGDPERITDWYLLAKQVHMGADTAEGDQQFNVEFTFFGNVHEEVLHWDPPHRYVYKAAGPDFPIKDYVACIEVMANSHRSGELRWQIYCDVIEGEHYQRILPAILPTITEVSMEKLCGLIGGGTHSVTSYF